MNLFRPSYLKRWLFFFFSDVVLIVLSLLLSLLIHFDLSLNVDYFSVTSEVVGYFIVVKAGAFAAFKIYRMTWRYVGIDDLINIILALVFAELMLMGLSFNNSFIGALSITGFPKRVFFMDGIISLCLIGGLRISRRAYSEIISKKRPAKRGKRTILLGAGNTGEMMLRDMARQGFSDFYPVGLLDDDTSKIGTHIHGVRVLGPCDSLRHCISKLDIEVVIVAIPSLNHKSLKDVYSVAKELKIESVKIVPRIYNYDTPEISLKALENISIEDLIGRQSIEIDYKDIRNFLVGKTVLVTGAGGSIGSEIVTQVCSFKPGKIILFDIDETELHNLGLKLGRQFPRFMDEIIFITGDVRDENRVEEVFDHYRPQIVFHAAAYKHVPMMEYNPREAVKVNILGTYALARAARDFGVDKFIMISTDKAVRPTSIMGATKRMAEYVCKAFNEARSEEPEVKDGRELNHRSTVQSFNHSTEFVSVRFGNVLGSRGSVLPLFLDQLKHGGPLTVTHKDMKRYFMTIPEAVSLVLQASTIGDGGDVLVLDMGEAVKITHIAEELIRIHGLEPYADIDITFTGLRPGEKLFEEILTAEEGTISSKYEKIFVARNSEKYSLVQIEQILHGFRGLLAEPSIWNDRKVKDVLKKYVKHYEQ